MACDTCKKRNRCVKICLRMEKRLSRKHGLRRELPLQDRKLFFLLEEHLRAVRGPYKDRHSVFLPELHRRMRKLTQKQRLIVEMIYWEGLSIKEISEQLSMTRRGVRMRLERAFERLRAGEEGAKK